MKPIKVGLLGFGLAGQVFHAPLIRTTTGMELTAIGTRSFEGKPVPKDVRTGSIDDVIDDPEIDLIVVATVNTSHFSLTCRALSAGKHVVVDKPFAVSLDEADQMISVAREKNRLLSVYQNRRWDAGFKTAKDVIASGELGNISYAELHFDRFSPEVNSCWREQPAPGAGNLFDLGSHLVDQAFHLFGRPRSVFADVTAQREGALVDDYFHLILNYGKLRVVLHSTSLVFNHGPRIALYGDQASFQYFGLDKQEEDLVAGKTPESHDWGRTDGSRALFLSSEGKTHSLTPHNGSYEDFYLGMANAILGNGDVPVPAQDARHSLALLLAAAESAEKGVRIELTGS